MTHYFEYAGESSKNIWFLEASAEGVEALIEKIALLEIQRDDALTKASHSFSRSAKKAKSQASNYEGTIVNLQGALDRAVPHPDGTWWYEIQKRKIDILAEQQQVRQTIAEQLKPIGE